MILFQLCEELLLLLYHDPYVTVRELIHFLFHYISSSVHIHESIIAHDYKVNYSYYETRNIRAVRTQQTGSLQRFWVISFCTQLQDCHTESGQGWQNKVKNIKKSKLLRKKVETTYPALLTSGMIILWTCSSSTGTVGTAACPQMNSDVIVKIVPWVGQLDQNL